MIIIGSGMSGMLAGQIFRSRSPVIYEKQPSLPNNHKALLRFRSDAVSTATGIKFKKVKVRKAICYEGKIITESNIIHQNKYSLKVSGKITDRSISNLDTVERYIAPDDFIQRLSNGLNIVYNVDARTLIRSKNTPIISTMPVNDLAEMLEYPLNHKPEYRSIYVAKADLGDKVDVYQTIYFPDLKTPVYRISITGNQAIAEFIQEPYDDCDFLTDWVKNYFGIPADRLKWSLHYQRYGKLIETNNEEIKKFIGWATTNYRIYSLGRWGLHRQILMDDVVNDIKVISNMIDSNNYRR